MNGMISRGTRSPSKHIPISDITLGWLKDIIVVISFRSVSFFAPDNRATKLSSNYNACDCYIIVIPLPVLTATN